jgi:predicted ATPase
VQTIQRVAPFFHNFILKPEKTAPNRIRLRWKLRGTDEYFDANSFSDGTLRFICLTTLLLQPHLPTMILLDEPELGLHPYAMQLLAGMMRSVANKTQIIASSQSVTLANQFDWFDLIIVEQFDNASQFKRLEEEQIKLWLEDYRIGDLWEKNLIGGTPPC